MSAAQTLKEILQHFASSGETPGADWALDEEHTSLGLDHLSSDGSKLWLDLEHDGTIMLLWRPAGAEKPTLLKFIHAGA